MEACWECKVYVNYIIFFFGYRVGCMEITVPMPVLLDRLWLQMQLIPSYLKPPGWSHVVHSANMHLVPKDIIPMHPASFKGITLSHAMHVAMLRELALKKGLSDDPPTDH